MHIRKLVWAIALTCVLAMIASAADISGKWAAESTGPDGQVRTSKLTLKVDGDNLTGTVSGRGGETAISEGKLVGDDISFVVVRNMGGQDMKIPYKGKVAGEEIKMTVQMRPDAPARELVYKRVKE